MPAKSYTDRSIGYRPTACSDVWYTSHDFFMSGLVFLEATGGICHVTGKGLKRMFNDLGWAS